MTHIPITSAQMLASSFPEPEDPGECTQHLILVREKSVLISPGIPASVIVTGDMAGMPITAASRQYLGMHDRTLYYAAAVPSDFPAPDGYRFSGIRELYGIIPDEELGLAAFAVRMMEYDRSTRYCGRCGARTRPLRTERAKYCSDCNLITYPRISPAIIVLIRRGGEILLARSPGFPEGMFSVIAGFVEPRENLEEAVRREVQEEVGVTVTNIRYFGSEPWPFPDSLMIGFVADHDHGEIVIDNNEIQAAGWFSRGNLPPLPSTLSISRALIDAWIRREI